MKTHSAQFRFYEELNDFLPPTKRKVTFKHYFVDNPSIKDVIESLGIPHTEIDLILVNGKAKRFTYRLKNNDHVAVYPMFESLDIARLSPLRKKPLRRIKFILDVHLGKLARALRLLGFDSLYRNNYTDREIVRIAQQQRRIVLTRDVGLLKNKAITRGYWLRATQPMQQIEEILLRFDLRKSINPFTRCLECNGKIAPISQRLAKEKLPLKARKFYKEFFRCNVCKRIYWQGSHYQKLQKFIGKIINSN